MEPPATTIDDAYILCDPDQPLEVGDRRYVDLNDVRGGDNLPRIVAQRVVRATKAGRYHQQLVTGHRGCGKSTELKRLQARLEKEQFFCIYLDVEDALDLGEITYQDILLSLARSVVQRLEERELSIDPELLADLHPAVRRIGWVRQQLSSLPDAS